VLLAQRFTRLVAVQQVDYDLTECQDFRKDHLGLPSWSGTSHRVEQCLAAPLSQRLSSPVRTRWHFEMITMTRHWINMQEIDGGYLTRRPSTQIASAWQDKAGFGIYYLLPDGEAEYSLLAPTHEGDQP
jgi:hypothetical protein